MDNGHAVDNALESNSRPHAGHPCCPTLLARRRLDGFDGRRAAVGGRRHAPAVGGGGGCGGVGDTGGSVTCQGVMIGMG